MFVEFHDLVGKTYLITGASRGIGADIAQSLAAQKANVVLSYRQELTTLDNTIKNLREIYPEIKITTIQLDLENPDGLKHQLEELFKIVPVLDGLINNAGVCKDQLLIRTTPKDIEHTMVTNFYAPAMLSTLCGRQFIRQQNGVIVNIASVVGLMGNPGQSIYAASKAAIIAHTKSVAKELASKNIRCNAIAPGFIQTDMTNRLKDETKDQYLSQLPIKRLGKPSDVSHLTLFLLSNASSYITGQTIKVDGGLYI